MVECDNTGCKKPVILSFCKEHFELLMSFHRKNVLKEVEKIATFDSKYPDVVIDSKRFKELKKKKVTK